MEKYADNCKFIFISNQLSKIHEPLKSRCLMIRIPLPTKNDLLSIALNVALKESISVKCSDLITIINKSNYNINKLFWYLELLKYKIPYGVTWHNTINIIVEEILNKSNYSTKNFAGMIKTIRELLYQLFITNIDFHVIIKEIMISLKNNISSDDIKYQIIEETSKFENRISQGTRHIVHLEAYLIKIIKILNI